MRIVVRSNEFDDLQELRISIGKEYKRHLELALLEKGETDMQLSTFILISQALGLRFALTLS